jgi:hypothetical protein
MVWQTPDAVDTVVCAPDDGWWYHPKHVEQFPDINKLCNIASCWLYTTTLLRCTDPWTLNTHTSLFLLSTVAYIGVKGKGVWVWGPMPLQYFIPKNFLGYWVEDRQIKNSNIFWTTGWCKDRKKKEKPALHGNTGMVDFAPRLDHVTCHVTPMLAYIYIPLLYRNIQVQ